MNNIGKILFEILKHTTVMWITYNWWEANRNLFYFFNGHLALDPKYKITDKLVISFPSWRYDYELIYITYMMLCKYK